MIDLNTLEQLQFDLNQNIYHDLRDYLIRTAEIVGHAQSFNLVSNETIWVLGGWYGVTSLLLLSRGVINVSSIRSFDVDPVCEKIADTLLNNWVWQHWTFKAFTNDCNKLDFKSDQYGPHPTLIINTSCEHFDSMDWFNNIPTGTKVAVQTNDMPHDDHVTNVSSMDDVKLQYPLSKIKYEGIKTFKYPDWSFNRFMLIGYK